MRSKIVNHAVIICKIFFKVFSRLGKIFNMHKAKKFASNYWGHSRIRGDMDKTRMTMD